MSTSLRQEQRLSHEQRLEQRLDLRRDLIEALRGERYNPDAVCPSCSQVLTEVQILKGFNADPRDYTTECPRCHARFAPKLKMRSDLSTLEMPFYCASQTLAQLPSMESVIFKEFTTTHAAIYRSAVYHFGSLSSAFVAAGLKYLGEEMLEWKDKVKPFLGRLSDTVIAKFANTPAKEIRTLRHQLGIPGFNKQRDLY